VYHVPILRKQGYLSWTKNYLFMNFFFSFTFSNSLNLTILKIFRIILTRKGYSTSMFCIFDLLDLARSSISGSTSATAWGVRMGILALKSKFTFKKRQLIIIPLILPARFAITCEWFRPFYVIIKLKKRVDTIQTYEQRKLYYLELSK